MKFNVYYGREFDEVDNKELLASFTIIEDAKLCKARHKRKPSTKQLFKNNPYIRNMRWYDYGNHAQFCHWQTLDTFPLLPPPKCMFTCIFLLAIRSHFVASLALLYKI